MVELLLRGDDLGYSEGINYGIAKSVKDGMCGSVGMMTNMDLAEQGYSLIRHTNVCLGQHTNICVGKPLSDPSKIPSLIGKNGEFKSSKEFREAKVDFVALEEVITEIEAQYLRFKEITGKEPEYIEGHAVESNNFLKGLEIVSNTYSLKYSPVTFGKETVKIGDSIVRACPLESMSPNYDPYLSIKNFIKKAPVDSKNLYVCHPGYVDGYLFTHSSMTLSRAKEVDMLCNKELKLWLETNDIQLITYREV